jgi:hypothetical protein
MPLVTENIDEARLAFVNVEARALSAELRASALQDTVDKLRAQIPITAELANTLTQQTADQAAVNAQLRTQQVSQIDSDIPLAQFIATVGMSAALGEATMPDRTIPSITTSVTAYHTPDGGLRFYQPEFGDSSGPGTTSFSLVKTPGPAGSATPRNLYLVIEGAQLVFDHPFWTKFATATAPPVQPAQQIVTEAAKILANVGSWSFAFLVQEVAAIATFETTLATLLAQPSSPPQVAAFATAVQTLARLAQAFDPTVKPNPVAGDLLALTAALDATVLIADSIRTA